LAKKALSQAKAYHLARTSFSKSYSSTTITFWEYKLNKKNDKNTIQKHKYDRALLVKIM
jgi:hypothetical protein